MSEHVMLPPPPPEPLPRGSFVRTALDRTLSELERLARERAGGVFGIDVLAAELCASHGASMRRPLERFWLALGGAL